MIVAVTLFFRVILAGVVPGIATVAFFFRRIEVFGPILLPLSAVFPVVTFAGNKGEHANDRKCAKNELFHVRELHSPSQRESKTSF